MALPEFPAVNYRINTDPSIQPFLAPIKSDFDGGNTRYRGRPGDRVRTITQTIELESDDYVNTLEPWLFENRSSRVIMPVWDGMQYRDAVVQLSGIGERPEGVGALCRVAMTVAVIRYIETLEIDGDPVLDAEEDEAYEGFTVTASGGVPNYTFSVHSGDLPDGITLNAATGHLSGTPTEDGSFPGIVIRVTDQQGETADLAAFTMTVEAA